MPHIESSYELDLISCCDDLNTIEQHMMSCDVLYMCPYMCVCVFRFKVIIGFDAKNHDDIIKWKHFPRYWPFVRGIHRSPVNSHTKASDSEL